MNREIKAWKEFVNIYEAKPVLGVRNSQGEVHTASDFF